MAKYLDSNGLSHFMGILKGLLHKHSISDGNFTTTSVPNVTSVGSAPTLGTAFTIPNISKKTVVTGATMTDLDTLVTPGTPPTLGTAFTIPNISKKTVVTGGSKTGIPNVTSAGSAASASVSGHKATFTNGVAPTLGTAIQAYTTLNTGDSVTVGTAFTVPNVTSVGTAATVDPDVKVCTAVTTGDSVTVGTAFTVPNVTSVGSAPTLGTAKTVLTGVNTNNPYTGSNHIDDN